MSDQYKIVGGQLADEHEWPWVVALVNVRVVIIKHISKSTRNMPAYNLILEGIWLILI